MEHFCSVTSLFDGSAGDIDVPCDAFGCPAACTNDAAGNTTAYGTRSYTYDDAGRMSQYLASGVVTRTFAFNGRGERVGKRVPGTPGSDTWYVYDEAGHLIGEYRGNGTRVREYVWLDDVPVAVFVSHAGTTYQYVLTDHLNTPRAVVLPTTNAIVWRWDLTGSAFGEHAVAANPDGDANSYTMPLRYPGQYHDGETALYYNYFRDYDPATGRYLQSDPIGLIGSLSTFSYSASRPFSSVDPLGLRDVIVAIWRARPFSGQVGHVFVGEANGQVLLSQFPNPSSTHGTNMTYGWEATVAAEGRAPDRVFQVSISDDDAFDAVAASHRDRPFWDWLPDGSEETNCVVAANDALDAGGVNPVFGPVALPADLDNGLNFLEYEQRTRRQQSGGPRTIRVLNGVPWE